MSIDHQIHIANNTAVFIDWIWGDLAFGAVSSVIVTAADGARWRRCSR